MAHTDIKEDVKRLACMVVVRVGLAPLLNIVTVCGMRMHAKHEQSKNHIKQA